MHNSFPEVLRLKRAWGEVLAESSTPPVWMLPFPVEHLKHNGTSHAVEDYHGQGETMEMAERSNFVVGIFNFVLPNLAIWAS